MGHRCDAAGGRSVHQRLEARGGAWPCRGWSREEKKRRASGAAVATRGPAAAGGQRGGAAAIVMQPCSSRWQRWMAWGRGGCSCRVALAGDVRDRRAVCEKRGQRISFSRSLAGGGRWTHVRRTTPHLVASQFAKHVCLNCSGLILVGCAAMWSRVGISIGGLRRQSDSSGSLYRVC